MIYGGWPEYVPVAQRKAKAQRKIKALRKKGMDIQPIEINGRLIARSFWGKAWCQHLEKFSDFENRLARGRTYVRNGAVCHLAISAGRIDAMVMGSSLYRISIGVAPLPEPRWQALRTRCTGSISSMLELLQGKLSNGVMEAVTDPQHGLFPQPKEIQLACDCPDSAGLCKHLAAVLYGVGTRLDQSPELLFLLREVEVEALIDSDVQLIPEETDTALTGDLGDIFGIELDDSPVTNDPTPKKPKVQKSKARKAPSTHTTTASAKPRSTLDITAHRIKAFRQRHALTQDELATLLGKSVSAVRRWESCQGDLNLQYASQKALESIFKLTNKKIVKRII